MTAANVQADEPVMDYREEMDLAYNALRSIMTTHFGVAEVNSVLDELTDDCEQLHKIAHSMQMKNIGLIKTVHLLKKRVNVPEWDVLMAAVMQIVERTHKITQIVGVKPIECDKHHPA